MIVNLDLCQQGHINNPKPLLYLNIIDSQCLKYATLYTRYKPYIQGFRPILRLSVIIYLTGLSRTPRGKLTSCIDSPK